MITCTRTGNKYIPASFQQITEFFNPLFILLDTFVDRGFLLMDFLQSIMSIQSLIGIAKFLCNFGRYPYNVTSIKVKQGKSDSFYHDYIPIVKEYCIISVL